jgi:hypothetical protein
MKDEEEARLKEDKEAERRGAEEAAKMSLAEERRKNIESENRNRRRLKLPLLPQEYKGSFTSYPQLIIMSRTIC